MLPAFLLPQITIVDSGTGPVLDLSEHDKAILFTLGINEKVEQESLEVAIFGSADGTTWTDPALIAWPQKFYLGVSSVYLPPVSQMGVRYLRAQWKTNRWGRGSKKAHFSFYVFAEAAPA